jgi:hypothetical protein
MKFKHLIYIVFISILLMSCGKSKPTCGDDEYLVDGRCVQYNQEMLNLRDTLSHMKQQTNYVLHIEITRASSTYEMSILFDDEKRGFVIEDTTDYDLISDQSCTYYTFTQKGYVESDCTTIDYAHYTFYYDFEFYWFQYLDGFYYLDISYHEHLTHFFNLQIENSQVKNFMMTIDNLYYHQFLFDVYVDQSIWKFQMTFSMYDEVNITLPEGGES